MERFLHRSALLWENFEGGHRAAVCGLALWCLFKVAVMSAEGAGHCSPVFAQLPPGTRRSWEAFPRTASARKACSKAEGSHASQSAATEGQRARGCRAGVDGLPTRPQVAGWWTPHPGWRAVPFLQDSHCRQGLAFRCLPAEGWV